MSAKNASQPLAGKTIVVTRAPEQARELVSHLEALGAQVLLLPTMSFVEPEDTSALDEALRNLTNFDWVLLTSQNAAQFFTKRLETLGVTGKGPRYAAVGPATARAAERDGLQVAYVASRALGEVLGAELATDLGGKRVLLPRSDRARPELANALRAAGAEVVDVVAYSTRAPETPGRAELARIERGNVDAITFASPSAFHNLLDELGPETVLRISRAVPLAAIGPVTAQAMRESGIPATVEAAESSSAGLAAAIAEYFARKSPAEARR